MTIRFSSVAEGEMVAAAEYYESQSLGVGHRFLLQVSETVKAIAAYPRAGTLLREGIRRRLVHAFPFAVIYIESQEEILIVAVMDLRREPDYWMNRI